MECDGLETDEVVAGGNGAGDGGGPRGVVSNHLAISPRTTVDVSGEETGLVDLEPLKRFCADTCAGGAGALSKVHQLYNKLNLS